jgi:hypothetical protein
MFVHDGCRTKAISLHAHALILYKEEWDVGRTKFVLKNMFGKQFLTPH